MTRVKYLFFLCLFVICGCNQDTIYRQKIEIPGPFWLYGDSVRFTFDIPDTSLHYAIELDVVHRDSFPFENCYVKINSIYPDKKVKSDVLSLEFADGEGNWLGKPQSGDLWVPIALQPVAKFKTAGHYEMVFYQHTRVDSLPGIKSLEMVIEKIRD